MNYIYIFFDVTSLLFLVTTLCLIPGVAGNAIELRRENNEPMAGFLTMVGLYVISFVYPGLLVLGDLIVRLGF